MTPEPPFSRLQSFPKRLRTNDFMGGISNRMKEIKRRRHRRQKLAKFQSKLKKATASEKQSMADKLRKLTPGCDDLIVRFGLEDRA